MSEKMGKIGKVDGEDDDYEEEQMVLKQFQEHLVSNFLGLRNETQESNLENI